MQLNQPLELKQMLSSESFPPSNQLLQKINLYETNYKSPVGNLLLVSDGNNLVGLYFEQKNNIEKVYRSKSFIKSSVKDLPIFKKTADWLDIYFLGKQPNFEIPTKFIFGSNFQNEVWNMLTKIPYGKTITYGDIAKEIAKRRGIKRMSAQAVGGAVGSNPISIIVPCHRVMGANNKIIGYGAGIDKKLKLLELEQFDISKITS